MKNPSFLTTVSIDKVDDASSFYQALGYGKSVKRAFDLGVNQLQLSNIPQLAQQISIIKLNTRKQVDASKVIFMTTQHGEPEI
jgi:hypothetical protein